MKETDFEKIFEKKLKNEIKTAINQTNIRLIIRMFGKEAFRDLIDHVGVFVDIDEVFDLNEECGAFSCRICGACGSNDYNIEYTEVRDVFGEQLAKYENKGTEQEVEKKLWHIKCRICGEEYNEYLRDEV